jgi:RHS repeat-associated protein
LTAVGSGGLFYEVQAQDAWGHTTQERRGGSLVTTLSYDPLRGWIDTVCTGASCVLQNWNFDFDLNGNLTRRDKNNNALREDMLYDKLSRLTQVTRYVSGSVAGTSTFSYDKLGNVCTKDGQSYVYAGLDGCNATGLTGSSSPHAVTGVGSVTYQYDANGNQRRRFDGNAANDRYVEYDALDQATFMARGSLSAPSADTTFVYGPDRSRYKRVDSASGQVTTTLYIGNVERITRPDGSVETRRTLGGSAHVNTFSNQAGVVQDRYALPDHLGSVEVVVNDAGGAVESTSFDPWGLRRGASNWSGAGTALATTTHGFTGQEQLDVMSVVHLNGRIYDPALGRFLQADPMIDAGTQGLNRYSYVLNNPLSATDPTGYLSTHEWGQIFMTVVITAGTLGAGTTVQGTALTAGEKVVFAGTVGAMSGAIQSQSLKGAAWGAFSAVTFSGIGTYFENAAWAHRGGGVLGTDLNAGGVAAKVLAHGVTGGVMQHLQGGKFGSGFAAARHCNPAGIPPSERPNESTSTRQVD